MLPPRAFLVLCVPLLASCSADVRSAFIDAAGGVFSAEGGYGTRATAHYKRAFWDYWGSTAADVPAAYVVADDLAGLPAAARGCGYVHSIKACGLHSVEHIVPQAVLKQIRRPDQRFGAENNALNWAPALRRVNTLRGNRGYDTDDDAVHTTQLATEAGGTVTTAVEFDAEGEWIVPLGSRGEIARAVLYMAAVYDLVNLGAFDAAEIRSFRQWSLADPPLPWETAYNQWMLTTYHTSNPLISNPGKWENIEDAW